MLSLDPQFRSLRMWEQRNPVPPPVLADELDDPRRLAYADEIAALPAEAHAMHLYEVDASVEDSDVLGMAFHGQQYTLPVYGYHRWWRAADSTEAFALPPAGGQAARRRSGRPTAGCSRHRTTSSTSRRWWPPTPTPAS